MGISPALFDKKILVLSRANAIKKNNEIYFQNLDGYYLDGIARHFKEMEILVAIHKQGLHPTYEIYKNYTYQFVSPNLSISDMPAVKDNSNSPIKHLLRLYSEWRILKRKIRNADFVYIFMPTFAAVMAVWLGRKFKKPFAVYSGIDWGEVAYLQYRWKTGPLKLLQWLYVQLCGFMEKWVMKNAPVKLVNIPKLFKKYSKLPGIIKETKPLIQIKCEKSIRKEETCEGDFIRVLFVGAVIPRKGVQYLIKGFVEAQRKTPDMELHLVGTYNDTEYKNYLNSIIKRKQIENKVIWHGYIANGRELFELYRDCDIFVLPSLSEGFPRVIWEAMSLGLPVIASNLKNIREKVGKKGLVHLVPPKNARAVGEAISKLIIDKSYRKKLIANGQNYVKELLRESASEQFISVVMEEMRKHESSADIKKLMRNFYQTSPAYLNRLISKDINFFVDYASKVARFCDKSSLTLDLGPGGSWQLAALRHSIGESIVGVDLSFKAISSCIQKKGIFLINADVLELPLKNELFDIVTSHALIEHIPEANVALMEMLRVLKKGGVLVISAPNMISPFRSAKLFLVSLTKGKFHPDGTLLAFMRTIVLSIKKWLAKDMVFVYRQPTLTHDEYMGSDYDAVFLVNPFDLEKFAIKNNLKVLNLTDATSRLGKVVECLFPKLAGGIFFVAQKKVN